MHMKHIEIVSYNISKYILFSPYSIFSFQSLLPCSAFLPIAGMLYCSLFFRLYLISAILCNCHVPHPGDVYSTLSLAQTPCSAESGIITTVSDHIAGVHNPAVLQSTAYHHFCQYSAKILCPTKKFFCVVWCSYIARVIRVLATTIEQMSGWCWQDGFWCIWVCCQNWERLFQDCPKAAVSDCCDVPSHVHVRGCHHTAVSIDKVTKQVHYKDCAAITGVQFQDINKQIVNVLLGGNLTFFC
jgi:hypothetical protein